jgi:hypothetical protein
MKRFSRIVAFVVLILPQMALSQYYSTGQNPASVEWKQINTANFQVIFPNQYSKTAQYIANLLEYAASLDTITLKANPKKTPVIIHNFTSVSNGMVVWAPRRMEFFTIPPQDSDGQEWFQQLAIHEYRHVIQISKLNQGLTKILTYLFGEQITGAVLGLYVPFWFLEGDAVATETALSQTGRGRSPDFAMPLRTQMLEQKIFSYDKAVLGSYKDFVPNHYILGYHLVANGTKEHGTQLWEHTLNNVGKKPYSIVPFSRGIYDVTGLNKTGFYQNALSELKSEWEQQKDQTGVWPELKVISEEKEIFTQYLRPFKTKSGTYIAEKRALDDIPRFVEIDEAGYEKLIFTPGFYQSGTLSYGNNFLAWAEFEYDPRWENRNYSVIRILNLDSGKVKTIGKKSRYFAPALSADGEKIVAVEVTEDQLYKIVVLDVRSGSRISEFYSQNNDFFSRPSFSGDGSNIIVKAVNNFGNRLVLYDPETKNYRYLSHATYTDISKPVFSGDSIVFIGTFNGISNLYSLNIATGRIYQITSVKYGLDDHFITNDGKIIFANYTAKGFDIAEANLKTTKRIPIENVKNFDIRLYETLIKQENSILEPEKIPDYSYFEKDYSKLANLFNFHSWAPVSIDVDNYNFRPGISLLSQNILSTAFTTLGWEYDLNEETGKYFVNFTYEGLYPAMDFRADYGRRKSYVSNENGERIDFSWMETNFSTNVRVPFNFTKNKFARFIQPAIKFDYVQLDMDRDSPVEFRRNNYKTLSYRLYAYNLLKRNFRDMNPRWGQIIDLNYRTAPFNNDTLGAMFSAETQLYFPGLSRHHSFNLYSGYQYRFDENLLFGNIIRFPRGHTGLQADEFFIISANYKLPLLYPDLSITSLAYIKRIKANFFYDFAHGSYAKQFNSWQSAGFEIFADLHLLRFPAPVELGYRLSFLPEQSTFQSALLFSLNFDVF